LPPRARLRRAAPAEMAALLQRRAPAPTWGSLVAAPLPVGPAAQLAAIVRQRPLPFPHRAVRTSVGTCTMRLGPGCHATIAICFCITCVRGQGGQGRG
jgi:hypothetical protein